MASSTPAATGTAPPSDPKDQGPCVCEKCWRRINFWRFGPSTEPWADFYLPPLPRFGGQSVPQPRGLCSKADVMHALNALCDRDTPIEWRLSLGRELVRARLRLEKPQQHFGDARLSERVEDMLEVGGVSSARTAVMVE
jgi:hypothetical protein